MTDSGTKKAALLLLALGADEAAEALRILEPGDVQKITAAMAAVKKVEREELDDVVRDFIQTANTRSTLSVGADAYLRSVLTKALGDDKAAGVIDRILVGSVLQGIEGLKWIEPVTVAELIRNEHPQTIATVMVYLDPQRAAEVLTCFNERTRNEVVIRIATLEGLRPSALRDLDDALSEMLAGSTGLKRRILGGTRVAADIISNLSGQHEHSAIESVREYDDHLAQKILDDMFTFEKLTFLDDRALRLLVRETESRSLSIALKIAPSTFRERIVKNMSGRAADLLLEEIEALGPVRLSEVEASQRAVVQLALKLADSGEITLGDQSDDPYI
jgi:flagellar motor switch protein FliG